MPTAVFPNIIHFVFVAGREWMVPIAERERRPPASLCREETNRFEQFDDRYVPQNELVIFPFRWLIDSLRLVIDSTDRSGHGRGSRRR